MSANNWAVCPRCIKNWESARDAAIKKAKAQYGKVPVDKYEEILLQAKAIEPQETPTTLREDWEIGTDYVGMFGVSYRCSCKKCGLEFGFNHACNVEKK